MFQAKTQCILCFLLFIEIKLNSYTKKEVVLGKYILVISGTVIGAILGSLASIILTLVMKTQLPNLLELLELAIGSVFGIGIVEAIQIPFIYKYGAEKGRIQIFIAIAVIAIISMYFISYTIAYKIYSKKEIA